MCESCGLSQLSFTVSPEVLYRNDYPYGLQSLKLETCIGLNLQILLLQNLAGINDLVVDVGSNGNSFK